MNAVLAGPVLACVTCSEAERDACDRAVEIACDPAESAENIRWAGAVLRGEAP